MTSSNFHHHLGLPFNHLNLRFNPFGELPRDIRALLAVVNVEQIVEQLGNPKFAVQFIGEMGRGKTTHLLAIRLLLRDKFRDTGNEVRYVYIDELDHPPIPKVNVGDVLIVDEGQRLSWLERRSAFRQGVPLAIGTHADLKKPLFKLGYEVLTIHVADLCTPEHLHACFNRRIQHARRYDGPIPHLSFQTATRLFMQYGNDIRTMEGKLYEVFQNLTEIGDV